MSDRDQIVEKLNVVQLAFARSKLTGMTPDRVAASIASFDFLYLSELEQLKIVAPSVRSAMRANRNSLSRLAPVGITSRMSRSRSATRTPSTVAAASAARRR